MNKIHLLRYLYLSIVMAFMLSKGGAQANNSDLSFVLISDTHNAHSMLKNTVERIQSLDRKPDFIVALGDNIDEVSPDTYGETTTITRSLEYFEQFDEILSATGIPVYYVLGNHEYSNIPTGKLPYIYSVWHMPYRYYSVDTNQFRLLFLDWNGFGGLMEEYRPNPSVSWPDLFRIYVNQQMEWIRSQADATDKRLIIFTHYADYGNSGPSRPAELILDNALSETLKPYKDRILAIFQGHLHLYSQKTMDGIPLITIPKNTKTGAFGQAFITDGALKLDINLPERTNTEDSLYLYD